MCLINLGLTEKGYDIKKIGYLLDWAFIVDDLAVY